MFPSLTVHKTTRRSVLLGWMLLAAVPVLYVGMTIVSASRNIVFWDEFDTALALILRINAGADWNELLHRFFVVNNEHRMVTSRLIFAASYWLTGTINFHIIGAIGNLFLVGACTWLLIAVQGTERRVRLGVVLAFVMFQLEHFENFLWSGASIDHFQVVMLGVGAIAALAAGTTRSVWGAGVLGVLATFTLAQGTVVWPVGALLLAHQRRWSALAGWSVAGMLTAVLFLQGFEFNPAHQIAGGAALSASHIIVYWLALLGGPLTLGNAGLAPLPGLLLLVGLGILMTRGGLAREPVAMFSAFFAVGALALIAYGRSELAGPEINSRYLVLGSLAWALLIFQLLELASPATRPYRLLICLIPALAAFNVTANIRYAPIAEGYVEVRDRAATSFMQYGQDGRGITRLHPRDKHADIILRQAEARGVYTLPAVSHETALPPATPSTRIIAHADEVVVNDRAVTVGGWAMIRGLESKRDQVFVLIRSNRTQRIYSTVTLQRPDVAKAYNEPGWRRAGFRAVIERAALPAEDFEVGVIVITPTGPEFQLLNHRLPLASGGDAMAVHFSGSP
ncbi:hypothetical protein [Horticoccus sp. 23ND18S-11]|uniref:hypothetical protein n=1 Tax=Horticoccus sp. 23ND18S-11 TaxID=3391832 RepID=UPI0039C934AA